MRFLENPHFLSWKESLNHFVKLRTLACQQFIYIYNQNKNRDDPFKWGDEIEGHVIKLNHEAKTARLSLRAPRILKHLKENNKSLAGLWAEECLESILESCPREPYGDVLECFREVEENMKKRRKEVLAALEDDETYLTVGMFPRLGVQAFTEPVYKPTPESGITMSLFVPDELICQDNPIYKATFISLEKRRGKRANVNIPIFKDRNTPDPFTENLEALGGDVQFGVEAKPNHVYEDCSVFGQASCSLQTTIQASCLEDSMFMHDQLCVLAPIMMALSASSPVRRGYLTDHDCRWQAMAESYDDRTRREINHPETLDYKIPNHSRWESNFLYFSSGGVHLNDLPIVYDEQFYEELTSSGIDSQIALQVACALLRSPLMISWEQLEEDETGISNSLSLFRFPAVSLRTPDYRISAFWRVEIKAMDVQITDFENAAYAIFVALFSRVVLEKKLSWLIPMSKLQENFQAAQKRDAVRSQKFWIVQDLTLTTGACFEQDQENWKLLSVNEIINGSKNGFPGIVPVIKDYLRENVSSDTVTELDRYLKLIQQRAAGETMTGAAWIRQFIRNHKKYREDSVVSEEITYDLITTIDQIQKGVLHYSDLLG